MASFAIQLRGDFQPLLCLARKDKTIEASAENLWKSKLITIGSGTYLGS